MNEYLDQFRDWLRGRTERERWLLLGGACIAAALFVQFFIAVPLRQAIVEAKSNQEGLENQLVRTERMANEIRELRTDLEHVEERIKPGENTNLFTLLEKLAGDAAIKDQLESIKPKQPSGNATYPETRVEVSIKGASLRQTVQFLHRIEDAPVLLIIRSLRIKSRDDSALLDVSFSVSSFKRA